MEDLMATDLYVLLDIAPTSTSKEIKTAYRKKALSCHPDKNPDNPRAAELFHELSRALEVLTDETARAAYDRVLQARENAKLRTAKLDARRKKFKDDLEAREQRAEEPRPSKSDEARLRAEVERLQKEGSRLVEEEIAFINRQISEQLSRSEEPTAARVKIKWRAAKGDATNGGYGYDNLHRILSKYGDIAVLVVSTSKRGSALVEFRDLAAARMATEIERGLAENPLTLRGLWDSAAASKSSPVASAAPMLTSRLFPATGRDGAARTDKSATLSFASAPDIFTQPRASDVEFEDAVLRNLRRAEERKKLIKQMEDENT